MNEALARLRRRKPTVHWDTIDEIGTPTEIVRLASSFGRQDPERVVAQREIRRFVEQAIDRLPEDFRIVLVARVVEEMTIDETAALLDIRPETVKTRLHRARSLLREALESHVGSVLSDVFPFDDPRCERVADNVVTRLQVARHRQEPFPLGGI